MMADRHDNHIDLIDQRSEISKINLIYEFRGILLMD